MVPPLLLDLEMALALDQGRKALGILRKQDMKPWIWARQIALIRGNQGGIATCIGRGGAMQGTMRVYVCYYSEWVDLVYEPEVSNTHRNSRPMPSWNPRWHPSLLYATNGTPKLISTLTGSNR